MPMPRNHCAWISLCLALLTVHGTQLQDAPAASTFQQSAMADAVISAARPDVNLEDRPFNRVPYQQIVWHDAIVSEAMIFKFDFSGLPADAIPVTSGQFRWGAWHTLQEGSSTGEPTDTEQYWGDFTLHEITAGNAGWHDTDFVNYPDGRDPTAVTWNSLAPTFGPALDVRETDNGSGPLYLDAEGDPRLVSNGGNFALNEISGIPQETLQRLIRGESIGLAMIGVADSHYSIHTRDSFRADLAPQLLFDYDVRSEFQGDLNADGVVDALDAARLFIDWGLAESPSDLNSDGIVDAGDAGVLFILWTGDAGPQSGSVSVHGVPEPHLLALVWGMIGSAVVARSRRRRL